MPSASVLDWESLVLPISEENPAGADVRDDPSPSSLYYQIKDHCKAARNDERRGLFGGIVESDEANRWRPAIDYAKRILATQAKDLEVASLLIEALARAHGFAGLRDGFRLTRELVERFWDQIHPMPDEYGLETRLSYLSGLNGSGGPGVLVSPIARLPITQGTDVGPFATWNVDQAVDIDRLDPKKKAERLATGGTDLEKVRQAVTQTPVEYFVDVLDDIEGALEEWAALGQALNERAGGDAPSTANIREALDKAKARIRFIAQHVLPTEEAAAESESAEGGEAAPAGDGAAGAVAGPVANREQAFKTLAEISEFFRKTEPHSPIAYLLERAVRWGRTPLPELLSELIPDQGARNTFHALTGVQTPDQPPQS